jgi:hypothetical protein
MTPEELREIKTALLVPLKKWLTFGEVALYINKKKTATCEFLARYGIEKSPAGYYSREEIDNALAGGPTKYEVMAEKIKIRI